MRLIGLTLVAQDYWLAEGLWPTRSELHCLIGRSEPAEGEKFGSVHDGGRFVVALYIRDGLPWTSSDDVGGCARLNHNDPQQVINFRVLLVFLVACSEGGKILIPFKY